MAEQAIFRAGEKPPEPHDGYCPVCKEVVYDGKHKAMSHWTAERFYAAALTAKLQAAEAELTQYKADHQFVKGELRWFDEAKKLAEKLTKAEQRASAAEAERDQMSRMVTGYHASWQAALAENAALRAALERAEERFVQIQQSEGDREALRDIAAWGMSEARDALDRTGALFKTRSGPFPVEPLEEP